MADAEVTIDLSKGMIMARGEQIFVAEILEKYKSIFEAPLKSASHGNVAAVAHEQPAKPTNTSTSKEGLADYPDVFDVNGEGISIIVNPPGNSIATQARNIALLYLFSKLKNGEQSLLAEEVKEQCKTHACFDSKNFSGQMKSQKNFVTVTGSNSLTALRLTVPGRKAAEELAKSLQASS